MNCKETTSKWWNFPTFVKTVEGLGNVKVENHFIIIFFCIFMIKCVHVHLRESVCVCERERETYTQTWVLFWIWSLHNLLPLQSFNLVRYGAFFSGVCAGWPCWRFELLIRWNQASLAVHHRTGPENDWLLVARHALLIFMNLKVLSFWHGRYKVPRE